MKIIVKTLKGRNFEIEVIPEYTVADVKKCIEIDQGSDVYPTAYQMLTHNGKILKDETTLEENKVADNSSIVIMLAVPSNKPKRQLQFSSGYNQQGFCPHGPATSQWGPRGPHLTQPTRYDYQHRGSYPSQNQQYPRPTYGNYPPHQQAPRSNFGWDQRPPSTIQAPSPQGGYGQPQGPDYAQPTPYSRTAHPAQSYGHGYNEPKYENQAPPQQACGGQAGQQPAAYPQGPSQVFNFSLILPYQGPVSSTQSYSPNATPQQPYPYASSGPMQQSYPPYGSAPAVDGYIHPPSASAPASVYPQQTGQPVVGYVQPGGQQALGYAQVGPTGNYGPYQTSLTGYTEQAAPNNPGYGYQGWAAYSAPAGSYGAPPTGQPVYSQPSPTQPGYDQSVLQIVGYENVPVGYDPNQMYGGQR